MFIDEVTHIFLADITLDGNIFAGLRETHKQIYIWLVALSFYFFNDPILAARVVSVLAGLVAGIICYRLTETFYQGRNIGYLALLFYLISPFAVLFDRMALADGLQTMLMGVSLLASVQLWRYPVPKWALILGVVFGVATFNKGYAALFYPAPFLLWLLWGRNISWRKIIKLLSLTYAMASVAWFLLLGIGWHIYLRDIATKSIANSSGESNFLTRVWNSVQLMSGWLGAYLTLPLAGLVIFAVVRMIYKRDKPGLILTSLVAGSLLAFATIFVELRSRYLFPLLVPLSVIVAWGVADFVKVISKFINKFTHEHEGLLAQHQLLFQIALFAVLSITSLWFSYLIVTGPAQAPFPASDKHDYIDRAQSPHGYRELAQVMTKLVQKYGGLIFLNHSLPGPLEIILTVYLPDNVKDQIDIVPIGSIDQITPQGLNSYAIQAPTITIERDLITSTNSDVGQDIYAPLWQVASFSNPNFPSSIGLYQWLLPPDFAVHWLQQGGDADPIIAWGRMDTPNEIDTFLTTSGGTLVDWLQLSAQSSETLQQALISQNIEYVLVNPSLIHQDEALFSPFITTDGQTLTLKQTPPNWRLTFAYPDLNCQWCLFQLRPPDHPAQVTYGDAIELEGYDISTTQVRAGEPLYVTLYWHSFASVSESYVIFVHLLDANGSLVGQIDELPFRGQWQTNKWQIGSKLADRHVLSLDSALPPGEYTISVGLYNPANLVRLSAQSDGNPVIDNAVALTEVSIE